MGNIGRLLSRTALLGSVLCGGCAFPLSYDVPRDDYNQPTVKTIVERIQCEIRDMVRDDRPNDPDSFHRLLLLNEDYDVVVSLSLTVNDSGGLAPTLTYVSPLANVATHFTLSGGATLSKARSHTFTDNIQLSARQIYVDWKAGLKPYNCPAADTNLAGSLGLKDLVSMAASTPNLNESLNSNVFGGTVQFVVTKNLTAVGPTWQLVLYKNIGALASLSEVNTDQMTVAFAPGPNKGKRMVLGQHAPARSGINPAAYGLVQQQILNSIGTQLSIQNQR